jgi:eukaryotic-like serine/threonine-protein kinase
VALASGSRLGTYEIVGPLGAGGMGEVYRARDTRLGRDVAIKVLPAEVASSPDRLARFEREARTVAGLNHPNIVTLFSVEDEDQIRFLTMELIEGQILSNLVAPGGLPLSLILEISIPLAEALVAAHEHGVIHRDLKPGNVMVTRERRVKVLDFGLAKIEAGGETARDEALTATAGSPISGEGQVLGTVPYMAPEQLRGEAVDARSDLFALGIILYELATGRRPFTGATPLDVSSSILRDAPEPLTRVRADLPGDLERIVVRCLEKNPRSRFQTALDVSNELRDLQRGLERGSLEQPASQNVASIAVLPFANRSRDEQDEYFSDGLADELLSMLAKIRGLRVVARSSSFTFKGRQVTVAEVGKALNVATVLEGSVRKAGNRVRISVQLVKVSDGYHLWSETYDRTLEDIFAVQDDIARAVVSELRTALLGKAPDSKARLAVNAEVAAAARGRGGSGEAHRLYMQGRYFVDRGSREDTATGIGHLREALELDPTHALAWAELARAWMNNANGGWAPPHEANARARKAVERALALEPDLAEGHARLGGIQKNHEWDWKSAEASYRRALELAPGNSVVLDGAGVLAESLGRLDDAIALMRRSVEQNPLSSASYSNLALVYEASGRTVEAEEACRKALELSPQRICIHSHLALILLDQGRGEEAMVEALKEPEEVYRLQALAVIHHAAGRRAESDRALGELIAKFARDWAFQVAEVHAARGETDAAFDWLERARAERDAGLAYMRPDPLLRSLHADPRWDAFLRKMGLEE